jgi:hypothetical protein
MGAGFCVFQQANAADTISGHIAYSTTWTAANSPYNLNNNVYVDSGVTLTIEQGTTVNLGSYTLQVNGALSAKGTSSNKILFTGTGSYAKIEFTSSSSTWSDYSNSGCIIDNAIFSSAPIVTSGSPKISNSYFIAGSSSPITVNSGSPRILSNTINFGVSVNGIVVYSGSATISNNYIRGQQDKYGILIGNSASATITYNNVVNCYSGIVSYGQAVIQNNNIMNNANDGIRNENGGSTIQYNVLANNIVGITPIWGTVQHNTITGNTYGIWGPNSAVSISNNNIYGNTESSVHLTENYNITLANNWWGTTDEAAINQSIWDYKNDPVNLGTAIFQPILTSPDSSSPSVPSSIPVPTQPPTPAPYASSLPTATPTNQPTAVPSQTEQPYKTTTPRPAQPTKIPINPIHQDDNLGDIGNVVVIVLATTATILIILLINRRFHRKPALPQADDAQTPI